MITASSKGTLKVKSGLRAGQPSGQWQWFPGGWLWTQSGPYYGDGGAGSPPVGVTPPPQ